MTSEFKPANTVPERVMNSFWLRSLEQRPSACKVKAFVRVGIC